MDFCQDDLRVAREIASYLREAEGELAETALAEVARREADRWTELAALGDCRLMLVRGDQSVEVGAA